MGGADVVVVGGGVIGCACARELARRGIRVVLVERDHLASGASGRNHGLLVTPTDPALVPMARAGVPAVEEVAAASPVTMGPSGVMGWLIVAAEEPDRAAARDEAEAARAVGVPVQRLQGDELRAAEPALADDLLEGWLLDDARRVDPAALTVALAQEAREAGATVLRGQPVRALLAGGGVRGVATDDGVVEAESVVVAAGPWTGALLRPLGIHLPIRAARGWLVQLGPAPGTLRHVIESGGWHPDPGLDTMPPVTAAEFERGGPPAFVGSVVHEHPDGTVLAGASRAAGLAPEPDDPDTPRVLARRAIRLVPALELAPVVSTWWGVRPTTPDGRPMVGRLGEGLLVATGHGGLGVTLAAGTAALVGALLTGGPEPFDAAPFLPDRFAG